MPRSSSTRRRTRSSRSSTRSARARHFKPSSSTRSRATGSRPRSVSRDLFSQLTVCDYLFDRDKIYAYLNLDDNELFIYQRLYELLAPDLPSPDLVIYLQTPIDVLRRRLRERDRAHPDVAPLGDDYVRELNEAYNHYFFHYTATPLLIVETSQVDLSWGEGALADLERQIRGMGKGTRYYVPRT